MKQLSNVISYLFGAYSLLFSYIGFQVFLLSPKPYAGLILGVAYLAGAIGALNKSVPVLLNGYAIGLVVSTLMAMLFTTQPTAAALHLAFTVFNVLAFVGVKKLQQYR